MALFHPPLMQLSRPKFGNPRTVSRRVLASAPDDSAPTVVGTTQNKRQYSLPVTLEESVNQVFVIDKGGNTECIAFEEDKPSYKRLQDILKDRKGGRAGKGWFGRLLEELKFNQDSLK